MKICAVCKNTMTGESTYQKMYICSFCGWVESDSAKRYEAETHRRYGIVGSVFAFLLVVSFIQSVKWGSSSLEVIPLKFKSVLGLASPENYKRLGEICRARYNPDCMETAHRDWTELYDDHDDAALEALTHLSRSLIFNHKLEEASIALGKYFALGGSDLEMAFYYARVLGQMNNIDTSIEYFEYVLKEKPEILQVTVLKSYVAALVLNKKLLLARDVILRLQKDKKKNFMRRELKAIKRELLASKRS